MTDIKNARILILSANGFEQSELEVPRDELRAKGATVHLATPDGEAVMGWDKKDWGRKADADLRIADARTADYDAVIIPGGQINPDLLRTQSEAVDLVRDFAKQGKVVAAICHGPWVLAEARVVEGRKMTSYHSIKTDIVNAGADWVDQEVVVSNGIVTSRSPDDLGAFVSKIVEEVEEGRHKRSAA
ncbi:MAG: type 1 glutamine amidotransferase domain-containing protein [Paracoccaceae bacterium]